MKRKLLLASLLACSIASLSGCNKDKKKYVAVKEEIAPYIFEANEYKELDYDFAEDFFKKKYDNWGGGCTCIATEIDGKTFVGRNMDLNISHKCAYVVRTDAGKYKTFGLQYTFRDFSTDYEVVKTKGIEEDFSKILPFMCDDIINEEGLYVEVNMRHGECYPNGSSMFSCQGTNKQATTSVYLFALTRYIAENCATIEEAKQYINKINIYSEDGYWNYCFVLADKTGAKALLEVAQDKVYWINEEDVDHIGQANFYRHPELYEMQSIKSGLGRFDTLDQNVDNVKNEKDLFNLMDKISYSHFYKDYETCKNEHFDPRSEFIGELDGYYGSYEFVMDDENEQAVATLMEATHSVYKTMTREQLCEAGSIWESTFTEVVDVLGKTIYCRFYENNDLIYKIDFNSVTKTNIFN